MQKDEKLCDILSKKMWVTKGSRFNAYRRLKKKASLSTATISFLSVYAIVISMMPYFKCTTAQNSNINNFFVFILSLIILIISLLEYSKDYSTRAERLYVCSNEITHLLNELNYYMSKSINDDELNEKSNEISNKYDLILKRCSENHDPVDYRLFQTDNPADYPIKASFLLRCWYYNNPYIFYYLLMVAPLVVYFLVINFLVVV